MISRDSKIFVSGHSGMVGKTMLKLLKDKCFSNVIVKDSSVLDLKNQNAVGKFFFEEKPDYVFHFAAKVGGIMANVSDPSGFLYDNLLISSNVIYAAYKTGVKKLLNLGSSCIYPRECSQPMKEEYLLSGKLEPTNEGYALSKIVGLKFCEFLNKQYETDFISLMPCNLYGINECFDPIHSHVISGMIMKFHDAKTTNLKKIQLWGTGSARREFLYVEDLVHAALYFMDNYSAKDLGNRFVNIGSGEDISVMDLANLISDIVGFKGEIEWDFSRPDGMPQKLLDVSRMKEFGFNPKISLREGIERTYEYYLSLKN